MAIGASRVGNVVTYTENGRELFRVDERDLSFNVLPAGGLKVGGQSIAAAIGDGALGLEKITPGDGILVGVHLGTPSLADDDRYVTSVDMQATAYTIANAAPPAGNPPRTVTVTVTAGDTADTLGDATIVGTDVNDAVISEDVTPVAGETVETLKAFKTVTAVTTPDWVIDEAEGTEDAIKVGFGNPLGLPRVLDDASSVFLAFLDNTARTPDAVTTDETDVALNTVNLTGGTYNGTKVAKVIIAI